MQLSVNTPSPVVTWQKSDCVVTKGYDSCYTAETTLDRVAGQPVSMVSGNSGTYYIIVFCVVRAEAKGAANIIQDWVHTRV